MIFSAGDVCSMISVSAVSSVSAFLWQVILFLWSWHWIPIFLALTAWVIWEIITRNGTVHYNSDNGFSPSFNRFVGSGTYLGFQTIVFLIFKLVIGNTAYCLVLPYFIHLIVFISTGLFLHLIGFWPYLWEPRRRHYNKGYYRRRRPRYRR
jgi:hypothetical protein